MIAELRALRDRITALGIPAHIGQVPAGSQPPYASISAPGHDTPDDAAQAPSGDESADVRVMVTHTNESNVYVALDKIRADLTPDDLPKRLTVTGRFAVVDFVRSEFVGTDRDVTYGATNRHPGYGVDTYHVTSQPVRPEES